MESSCELLVSRNSSMKFAILVDGEIMCINVNAQEASRFVADECGLQLDIPKTPDRPYDEIWSYASVAETNGVVANAKIYDGDVFSQDEY